MKLKIQKRLAADVFGCSEKHVRFDTERLDEIKESITKADIKSLIKDSAIYCIPKRGVSRVRARKIQKQKSKGQMRGKGSRKGKKTARFPKKEKWMIKIRTQRELLRNLKDGEIVDQKIYRELYKKAQGGFFRSRRHIKLYIEEHGLAKNKK
ncbi:50S ribosomal protein L19e [Candidatus Woesearchaeota archaeon B3_Woes]|nr:MAG: 50S ribosomal protein L19e [Candidatus Woesearchaeota archaeon B3_Woes]